jgi:hypothetical protein
MVLKIRPARRVFSRDLPSGLRLEPWNGTNTGLVALGCTGKVVGGKFWSRAQSKIASGLRWYLNQGR